jgi:hypothetical protein
MAAIDELIGQDVTLRKVTETLDGFGHLETEGTSDVSITANIQPISQNDKDILKVGEFQAGDKKGYFKHRYTCSGSTYTVEVGDIIVDWNSVQWRVLKIYG